MTVFLLLLGKTLAVFVVSGLALLLLRRASASARHLVCLLTLTALLALPLFSLTLPGWRLPVLTEPTPARKPMLQEPTQAQAPTLPKREGEEFGPLAPTNGGGGRVGASPTPTGLLHITHPLFGVGGLLALYTLGVLLALVRPLLGLRGIAHLRRLCVPVTDAPTLDLADDCAAVLRLSSPVLLCRAAVSVPMTWGWRRPIVLLPSESVGWLKDRTQAVLLHEMAHIKRRDWLSHRLADCVCAVYWFHPFVWLTARRLRAEGEIACDDLVLASGIAAPDYARHLLDIARALPPTSPPTQSAIAMAQTSQIEGRLTMILDKTRSRRTLTGRVLIAAFAFGVVALVPLAMVKPTAKAQAVTNISEIQTIGKISVQLEGITEGDRPGSRWWTPNGLLLPKDVYNTATFAESVHDSHGPDTKDKKFSFRLLQAPQDANIAFEAVGGSGTGTSPHPERGKAWTMIATFPLSLKTATLRVGVAAGTWSTAASNFNPSQSLGTGRDGNMFLFTAAAEAPHNGSTVTIANNDVKQDYRFLAIDTQNVAHFSSGSTITSSTITQRTLHFDLPLSKIKEIRVETRPYQWVEFKDVALQLTHDASLMPGTQSEVIPAQDYATPWTSQLTKSRWQPRTTFHMAVHIAPRGSGTPPDPPVTGQLVSGPGKAANFLVNVWKPGRSNFLTVKFDYTPKVTDKVHPDIIHLLTKKGAVAAVFTYCSV